MGKGSNARPFEVPKEQFNNNWEATFGKKNKEAPKDQDTKPVEKPDAK